MKRALLTASVLVLGIGLTHAQGFGPAGSGEGINVFAPCALGPDDITQSFDCGIEQFQGVSCLGAFTTDTQWLRRFQLTDDHAIIDDYTVDEVQFGIEESTPGAGVGQPITVNIYRLAKGADLTYANLGAPLDTATYDVGGDDFTIFTAVMNGTATIDPAVDDLVVEYRSFDHNDAGNGGLFFPGANTQGESRPTYIAADDCGIFDPLTMADVGFPDSANVVVVNGTEGGDPCVAKYLGTPRAVRTSDATNIRFSMGIKHNRGAVRIPIFATLEDNSGNIHATLDMGLRDFAPGERVRINGVVNAPADLASGTYILRVRLEKMKGFETRSHLVVVN